MSSRAVNLGFDKPHMRYTWMTYNLCNITRLVTHWQKIPMNKPWEGEEEDV